jgi:hypothetical protein
MRRRSPFTLISVGLLATGYGLYLIKRGIEGDTLLPGTLFTYVPRWMFIVIGLLLQIPLPAALWFLWHIHGLSQS